jgi:hypothetical protein
MSSGAKGTFSKLPPFFVGKIDRAAIKNGSVLQFAIEAMSMDSVGFWAKNIANPWSSVAIFDDRERDLFFLNRLGL